MFSAKTQNRDPAALWGKEGWAGLDNTGLRGLLKLSLNRDDHRKGGRHMWLSCQCSLPITGGVTYSLWGSQDLYTPCGSFRVL